MIIIAFPALNGEYVTRIDIADKRFIDQKFWIAEIFCITPTYKGVIPSIRIPEWKMQGLKQGLKRIAHTGTMKFELVTREREEFILSIHSFDSGTRYSVDVLLRTQANFMRLRYEINSSLLF